MPELLDGFFGTAPPELFASAEAEAFAGYLRARELDVPHLDEVLAYECAGLRAMLTGEPQSARFDHEPLAVLTPLVEGGLPDQPEPGPYEPRGDARRRGRAGGSGTHDRLELRPTATRRARGTVTGGDGATATIT